MKSEQETLEEFRMDNPQVRQKRCGECGDFIEYRICLKCRTYFSRCRCGWKDVDCGCEECVT